MVTITASEFKAKCLNIMDNLNDEGVVVTKRGKPVARIVPYEQGFAQFIGCMEGKVEVYGDIMSTGVEWDAAS